MGVLGQALRAHGPLAPGQGGGSDLGTSTFAAEEAGGREVQPARVSHSRWPAAGREPGLSFQPGCPSPRLSCAEDCVDATAGLPTNTTQQNVTKPLGFLGIS